MSYLLLVSPWIYDFSAYDFWLKPIGLLALASALREQGMEIKLVDFTDPFLVSDPKELAKLKRRPDGRGKFFAQELEKPEPLKTIPRRYKRYGLEPSFLKNLLGKFPPPKVILIATTMTYWYQGYQETIKFLREIFKNSPIIVGGLYTTILPEHSQKNLSADYYCLGDYEQHLSAFLKEILGEEINLNPPERTGLALDLYPHLEYGVILTGRGCPFRCKYCLSWKLHPRLRRKSPEQVLEEIIWQNRSLGLKNIAFYDDALFLEPEAHILLILEGVVREGLNLKIHTPNGLHLKPMSPELAELMKKAGFETIRFGLETTNPERQKQLGAKASLDDLARALQYLEKAGYERREIGVYLLAGLPGQSPEEIEQDIKAVKKLGARPYLSEYSPIPQTELWEEAVEYARFPIDKEPLFHNCSLLPCAHPELTPQKLTELKNLARD